MCPIHRLKLYQKARQTGTSSFSVAFSGLFSISIAVSPSVHRPGAGTRSLSVLFTLSTSTSTNWPLAPIGPSPVNWIDIRCRQMIGIVFSHYTYLQLTEQDKIWQTSTFSSSIALASLPIISIAVSPAVYRTWVGTRSLPLLFTLSTSTSTDWPLAPFRPTSIKCVMIEWAHLLRIIFSLLQNYNWKSRINHDKPAHCLPVSHICVSLSYP